MLRVTYTNYPVYEPRPGSQTKPQGGERWALEVLPTPADQRLEFFAADLRVQVQGHAVLFGYELFFAAREGVIREPALGGSCKT